MLLHLDGRWMEWTNGQLVCKQNGMRKKPVYFNKCFVVRVCLWCIVEVKRESDLLSSKCCSFFGSLAVMRNGGVDDEKMRKRMKYNSHKFVVLFFQYSYVLDFIVRVAISMSACVFRVLILTWMLLWSWENNNNYKN